MLITTLVPCAALFAAQPSFVAQFPVHEFLSSAPGEGFGAAVRTLGDLDGDGLPEVAVGRPDAFDLVGAAGVSVFRGGDGALLYDLAEPFPVSRFGSALGRVPDLDGDGRDELLVGAPGEASTPGAPNQVALRSGASGSLIHAFAGPLGSGYGAAVVGLEDVNGDGFADLAIGAPTDGSVVTNGGRVYVYSGINSNLLHVISGSSVGEELGTSLAAMPDQDGDGAPELLVGAPGASSAYLFSGAAGGLLQTFVGPAGTRAFGFSVAALTDLDGDSLAEVVIGAPEEPGHFGTNTGAARVYSNASATTIYELTGGFGGDYYGFAVTGTADLNHDGVGDFVVGAPLINSSSFYPAGFIDARSGATGEQLFNFSGNGVPALFGWALDDLGDWDGDGLHDILIGAPGLDYVTVLRTEGPIGQPFCFGDGSGGVCPCGNFNDGSVAGGQAGCANGENAGGGQLFAAGSESVAAASLRFLANGLDPDAPGLYFQGTTSVNGGNGSVLGDGLLCAGGTIQRLEVVSADAFGSSESTVEVVAAGGVQAGDVRTYQLWYRNPGTSPCAAGFNLTNGVEIQWTP